ncbi:MAG: FMN-binding protein [Cellulomonadaceae bacterium]|nr:FMN-binding protein [Cellulomonadaceae bacterium]
MRRILIALATTITGVVLVFAWPTSLNRSVTSDTAASGTTGSGTSSGTGVSGTFDGAVTSMRYGDVQVRIVVENGVITSADAISYPTQDHESAQINSQAVPMLNSEVVSAQSASISMVSHATYTSQAYITSLQDALDQAGL